MSYKKYLGLGAALVSLSAIPVSDAHAVTNTTVGASATVVTAVAFTNPTPLHFGEFTYSGAGSIVLQTTTGARSPSANITGITGASNETAGVLAVSGVASAVVNLTFPTTATITHATIGTGATSEMTINAFQVETDAGGRLEPVTIGTGGTLSVPYGGTLNIDGNEAAGAYSGTFSVIAAYN